MAQAEALRHPRFSLSGLLYLEAMNQIRSVCVYCGSSKGHHPTYERDAIRLAEMLARSGIRLINGGGSIGLMGVMADVIMERGGEAIGVIPQSLEEKEIAHRGMTELIVVPDMHTRKLKMVNLADAFIALPGGFGTMDEVFETLTWAQLKLHHKPIILYNPEGFYDLLLAQVNHMTSSGFINTASRSLLMSTADLEQVIPMLRQHKPAVTDKWTY